MKFPKLNLPSIEIKTKLVNGNTQIFDIIRKKYIILTPEEWVRQHFIRFLNKSKKYPLSLMQVEKKIKNNLIDYRADIILNNKDGMPNLIVECKAPNIKITQKVFDQISRYNLKLNVEYWIVSNGLKHFCCKVDNQTMKIKFLSEIPDY